jgi:hypothetical protein
MVSVCPTETSDSIQTTRRYNPEDNINRDPERVNLGLFMDIVILYYVNCYFTQLMLFVKNKSKQDAISKESGRSNIS